MQSKNKPKPTNDERAHIERIKSMDCIICGASGPSDAHEPEQGLWFLAIPLCRDCHQGSVNGWHGQKRIWKALKMDEQKALNMTLSLIFAGL